MSIVTRCPSCGTTFRVTPPQLQAHRGMVRCGNCAEVFDGFKTLATLSDSAPKEPPPEQAAAPEIRTVPDIKRAVIAEPAAPPAIEIPAAPREAVSVPSPELTPPPPAFEMPAATPRSIKIAEPRRSSGSWGLGVLLMLVGLAAQGAYFYRSDIAAFVPETRPYLAKMCELLRCSVALPQRPRQITIEASDLQAIDPANPGLIALTATLRNQASTELGYPALDVVLTNTKDHTVARRIFLPADYLAAGKDARGGIAPNAEITIRLDLDTGDLGAAGFRLDLVAAPAR